MPPVCSLVEETSDLHSGSVAGKEGTGAHFCLREQASSQSGHRWSPPAQLGKSAGNARVDEVLLSPSMVVLHTSVALGSQAPTTQSDGHWACGILCWGQRA